MVMRGNSTLVWGDLKRDGGDLKPEFVQRGILDLAAAGDALFQEVVNRIIQVCHKRVINAIAVLEFRPGSGDAHHLIRQTPGPDGKWVDDTDSLTCDGDLTDPECGPATYAKVSFPYKCMLVCGSVTRKVIARGRDFADVFAIELAHSVERAMFTLEKAIFQGDPSGAFGAAKPKEFEGLLSLMLPYNGVTPALPTQVFVPDDAVGDAVPANSVSGTLKLKLLDEAIDETKPGDKVIFVSKTGGRIINSRLQAQQVHNDVTVVNGGFRVATYDDHPIIKTDGIPDAMAWGLSGGFPILTALSGATGTARTTAVLVVNTDDVWIDELTPLTVEPLPQCTTQRKKFEAYWDGSLVLGCPEGVSMIIGILPIC